MRKPQAPKIKSSKAEKNKMPPRSLTRAMPRNLIPALWALVFHGQDIHNAALYLLRQIAFVRQGKAGARNDGQSKRRDRNSRFCRETKEKRLCPPARPLAEARAPGGVHDRQKRLQRGNPRGQRPAPGRPRQSRE